MSSDVITLDGLKTVKLAGTPDTCGRLVSIEAPMLGQAIQVCETDVKRLAGGLGYSPEGRKPGRPKGSTVKSGRARKPRVKDCKKTTVIVTKRGRRVCKCTDKGNKQIMPNKRCDL